MLSLSTSLLIHWARQSFLGILPSKFSLKCSMHKESQRLINEQEENKDCQMDYTVIYLDFRCI